MMKKWLLLSILCAALCLCMCACAKAEEKQEKTLEQVAQQLNEPFVTTANITYRDVKAVITIDKEVAGCYSMAFVEPASLQGIVLKTQGDIITLSYKDISMDFSASEFFSSNVAKTLIATINQVTSQSGISMSLANEQLVLTGMGDTGEFKLVIDPKNSNMMKLEVPSSGLKVEFENFQFLQQSSKPAGQ